MEKPMVRCSLCDTDHTLRIRHSGEAVVLTMNGKWLFQTHGSMAMREVLRDLMAQVELLMIGSSK